MSQIIYSKITALFISAMLVFTSVNILIAVIRMNKTYMLLPSRFLYPANCKPENCKDIAGFIAFITPRLIAYVILTLLIAVLFILFEMTDSFTGVPALLKKIIPFILFLPLFVWYIVFINKAGKNFW